jgi:hypothetical protein
MTQNVQVHPKVIRNAKTGNSGTFTLKKYE